MDSVVESKALLVSSETLASNTTLWEFVKQGLLAVKAKIGTRSAWTPGHVRQAILNKGSELWVVLDGEEPVGFYVLSLITDPFINVPTTLFIWIAYAVPGKWGLIPRHLQDIKERARYLGVDKLEMMSPRIGWLRKLLPLGWEVSERIYGCKL